jgi:hypothetical protein
MDFSTIFILLVAFSFVAGLAADGSRKKSQKKNELTDTLGELAAADYLTLADQYISEDGDSAIAIDDMKQKVCLVSRPVVPSWIKVPTITFARVVPYAAILSSEVVEDGVQIMRTNRTSQAASALIGGLVAGGIGAVVGALTGSKSTRAKVKRIGLRITVADIKDPLCVINFINVPAKQRGFLYNISKNRALHWHALIDVIIRRTDHEDVLTGISSQGVISSAADERRN